MCCLNVNIWKVSRDKGLRYLTYFLLSQIWRNETVTALIPE